MILTDNETKVDLLNNEAIAATIIGLLRAKPDHPVTIPVLAKLMLAERFIPRLFEQIAFVAAVHPQGLCEDLEALETGLATAGDKESEPKGHKTSEPPPAPDSAVLTEWKSLETVRD